MKYQPKNKKELKELVDDLSISLGDIDTSLITDMSGLFKFSKRKDFSGIENWNVSNVKDMSYMFAVSIFDRDISNWNVSNVEDMSGMFSYSKFSYSITKWDVSNVKKISNMFNACEFNNDTVGSKNLAKLAYPIRTPIGRVNVTYSGNMFHMNFYSNLSKIKLKF